MKLKVAKLKLKDLRLSDRNISKLRGYIGNKFKDDRNFHNHNGINYDYRYPLIQYKNIKGVPTIVGINDGVDSVMMLATKLNEVVLADEVFELTDKEISIQELDYIQKGNMFLYKFITPWMGLNQKNYEKYKNATVEEKKRLLERTIIGNILSTSKGLKYTVENKIEVISLLESKQVIFKEKKMLVFTGKFMINFELPDYIGIGKAASRGFGVVKRCRGGRE